MYPTDLSSVLWRKSARSGSNGMCVEVARLSHEHVGVRDSKDKAGPALVFTPTEWNAFVTHAKNGEFDAISC